MPEFNNMTLIAAANLLGCTNSHSDLDLLELEWGIQDMCRTSSKSARVADLARIAIESTTEVLTVDGQQHISKALVTKAIASSPPANNRANKKVREYWDKQWAKLIAGLKMDGFEAISTSTPTGEDDIFGEPRHVVTLELRRMLPDDAPELDFREAESEIDMLLDRHGFLIAKGHLDQAISNFTQGKWSSTNAMIRDYYQELLDKIAEYFGCEPHLSDDAKRQYLASAKSGPFLFHEYNEWENDRGKPSFVLGLWARLHPHGSHPGLSEEEDCAFRIQIILITTRIFLRRFDKRVSNP